MVCVATAVEGCMEWMQPWFQRSTEAGDTPGPREHPQLCRTTYGCGIMHGACAPTLMWRQKGCVNPQPRRSSHRRACRVTCAAHRTDGQVVDHVLLQWWLKQI